MSILLPETLNGSSSCLSDILLGVFVRLGEGTGVAFGVGNSEAESSMEAEWGGAACLSLTLDFDLNILAILPEAPPGEDENMLRERGGGRQRRTQSVFSQVFGLKIKEVFSKFIKLY